LVALQLLQDDLGHLETLAQDTDTARTDAYEPGKKRLFGAGTTGTLEAEQQIQQSKRIRNQADGLDTRDADHFCRSSVEKDRPKSLCPGSHKARASENHVASLGPGSAADDPISSRVVPSDHQDDGANSVMMSSHNATTPNPHVPVKSAPRSAEGKTMISDGGGAKPSMASSHFL
jgi:hypothetical protein